ncbi:MAG TPA: DUF92 domain-containing protein [Rubricoccaceae bacterium]|jgi:uncharacterized protein (TIGR00297 family)
MTNTGAFLLFSGVLLAAVGAGEGLRVGLGWAPESTRRVVHAGVGIATALCPPLFSSPAPVYALTVLFVGANAVALRCRWFPAIHGAQRASLGTDLFPAALIGALFLCWTLDPGRVFVLQTAFLVLGLADPAASLVGTRAARPGRYTVAGAVKSVAGSAAFALVSAICTAAMLIWVAPASWGAAQIVAGTLAVAGVATACEASGRRGWDNVLIVLGVVVPLAAIDARPDAAGLVAAAVGAGVVFGAAAFRARALDLSGALAGGVLAFLLVAVGGVAWAVPALAFFVASSALSRVGRARKADAEALAEKGSRRDAGQVAANGGIAAALLAATLFWPDATPALYAAFLGAFAAAAADTWATEIGTLVGGPTRRLGLGPRVAPGTSGGVSAAGTLGAISGAAFVAMAALPFTLPAVSLAVALAGVAGAFIDTVLGATLQARYRLADGTTTERAPSPSAAPAFGIAGVTNDCVNGVCTLVGALLPLLIR